MIQTQHSDVRNTDKVRETQDRLILNLVRADDGTDFIVGAGFRHPFPGMVEALRLAKKRQEEEAERKHKLLMSALQQQIEDLQDQLAELNRKIRETEEARQRTRSSIAKLQNGEMPELTKDGGSTPFSRTVIKRLKTPDHALPIVFASVDCESAQCS